MKVFHIVCVVLMIAMMQHTCLADEQTEIIYGDGWTHYDYNDGTQAHKLAPLNYLRWDNEWRPKTEMNLLSGDWPYLVEEFDTYYLITRLDDSLTLSKTYRTYDFQPYKIGVQIILTPTQLNRISTYHNVGGTDYWYIPIPQSLKQTVEHLNWDNKLPTILNETGSILNQSDNVSGEWLPNYKYQNVGGELRLYYNQMARSFGITSNEITFVFNSYIINSSTNWANTSYSNFAYDRNTGYLILPDNMTDGLVLYHKMSGSSGITSYDMNLTSDNNGTLINMNTGLDNGTSGWNSSGKYGHAISFDGVNDGVDEGNNTQVSNFTISLYATFDNLYRQPLVVEYFDADNYDFELTTGSTNTLFGGIRSGGSDEFTGTYAINTGQRYYITLTFDGPNFRLWIDGINVMSKTDMTLSPSKTGTVYIGCNPDWHNTGARYFDGVIDEVRIYDHSLTNSEINQTMNNTMVISDNVTHWHDAGAGYQGSQFKFIFNNDSNSFLEGWVSADNSTWYQVTDNITNDTLMNIPAAYKNQTQYIRVVLKGNGTSTPEEIEAWIVSESVGPGPTPTPTPAISVSPAQYDELDLPLILYILMISMLYLLIAFRNGAATIELSLIYLIFAFIFLLFQTVTISVNNIYLILFLLLFMISIAGITLEKRSW